MNSSTEGSPLFHESEIPAELRGYFEETEANPVPCTVLDPFRWRGDHGHRLPPHGA